MFFAFRYTWAVGLNVSPGYSISEEGVSRRNVSRYFENDRFFYGVVEFANLAVCVETVWGVSTCEVCDEVSCTTDMVDRNIEMGNDGKESLYSSRG